MKKLLLVLLFIFPTLSWGQTTNFITPNDFGMPTYSYPFTRFWLRGSIPAGSNPAMDFHGRYRFTFYCDTMEFTTLYARLNASPQRIVTIGSDGTLSSYDPNFLTSQTQADWNATSGAAFIQNKPALNVTNWNNAYSWGDWRLENFLHTSDTANHWLSNTYVPDWASITGKPTIPTNTNQLTNGAGFLTSESDPLFDTKFATKTTTDLTEGTNLYWTGARFTAALTNSAINTALTSIPWSKVSTTPTTLSGYGITDGVTSSTLSSYATTSALTTGLSGKENTITAGTTGQYWRGDKTWQTLSIPSNTSQISESGNLYYTDARARAAISLTTTGTGAASYNSSTGILNVPTPTAYIPSINSVTRPINSTTFTPSSTLQATLNYCIQISCTASIGSNASGSVLLQYSTNGGSSWNDAGTVRNSNTVTLAVALNSVTIQTATISAAVPPNALCRLVPSSSGTTSITWVSGQEIY